MICLELYQQVKQINEADYTINRLIYKHYKKYLASSITTQQAVLLDIVYYANKITVGEIAVEMNISSSAVSQLIAKMEKNQFICRTINPDNRREIFITLDTKGWEYFDKQEHVERAVADRLFSKLTLSELNELERIMKKLKEIAIKEFI
ncbi:MarR family winged helix-turn-helix transcriptional regulator [Aneurinibacillus aneurinilyticus]|jgi:DNA-binding MarR family transcriptional regulator|uniref:Transcriptional regulator, MarR family n=1 Tax=Aneurinibacillus aneurinilyticus ATCC 12856 TaxID=649747 RepID=U1YLC4_ANEAE|nr:MarR family transcriptional regulator [Aneurinibacillus aneurinilyticus]ERI11606.1 transcriptional regulator, MarR family [Aneurinibacillus aneurinilyticus ATCC 12856]MED0709323.1 MarR family transcriptional regulator [Aneurinibacillus aneurinilyticus]MED0726137.1 MarR family transcriptional regulator [Aneurinibacillus aneurinilyticus]MED0731593.1 MarR family transcriptional regulator [Aneurinibacillus aneurinilyticus]MED0742364.1 MarR family transcriptional regulator [Aneurinibacillus aneu